MSICLAAIQLGDFGQYWRPGLMKATKTCCFLDRCIRHRAGLPEIPHQLEGARRCRHQTWIVGRQVLLPQARQCLSRKNHAKDNKWHLNLVHLMMTCCDMPDGALDEGSSKAMAEGKQRASQSSETSAKEEPPLKKAASKTPSGKGGRVAYTQQVFLSSLAEIQERSQERD